MPKIQWIKTYNPDSKEKEQTGYISLCGRWSILNTILPRRRPYLLFDGDGKFPYRGRLKVVMQYASTCQLSDDTFTTQKAPKTEEVTHELLACHVEE